MKVTKTPYSPSSRCDSHCSQSILTPQSHRCCNVFQLLSGKELEIFKTMTMCLLMWHSYYGTDTVYSVLEPTEEISFLKGKSSNIRLLTKILSQHWSF